MAIHPLQVFAKGFAQWKKNLWACAGIVASLYVPFIALTVLGVFAITYFGKQIFVVAPVAAVLIILGIYVFNCAPIAVIMVSLRSRSEKPKVFPAIKEAFAHVWRFFATNLLSGLCIAGVAVVAAGVGFLLANTLYKANNIAGGILIGLDILAGICALVYFGIRLSMSSYACVLEKRGPAASLNRSFSLVKKNFFPVAGVYLLFAGLMLVVLTPTFIFAAISSTAGQVSQAVIRIAAELFVTPLFINAAVVLWDELKPSEAK
jgi:hypothetical protein